MPAPAFPPLTSEQELTLRSALAGELEGVPANHPAAAEAAGISRDHLLHYVQVRCANYLRRNGFRPVPGGVIRL